MERLADKAKMTVKARKMFFEIVNVEPEKPELDKGEQKQSEFGQLEFTNVVVLTKPQRFATVKKNVLSILPAPKTDLKPSQKPSSSSS